MGGEQKTSEKQQGHEKVLCTVEDSYKICYEIIDYTPLQL